jgi:2-polyprenyl-6-methoxyphenol hydroxylase-like FAD-dependent oxidoreductase
MGANPEKVADFRLDHAPNPNSPTMLDTDVAIVGGGLAGATTAAMLGRKGHDAILIDPHNHYPPDFRCEKLDASQIELLRKTGLADAVFCAATVDQQVWIGRFGRVVERKPNDQPGILYNDLVNTIRAQIPLGVKVITAKANAISTSGTRQQLTLSNGEKISARLIVLANGLNFGLRHQLGIEREVISACHSLSIGFYLRPVGRPGFEFRALTYYSESVRSRVAYVTLFPIGAMMRGNLFVYRGTDDPWLGEMRQNGAAALFAVLPRLRALIGDVEVRDVKVRPVDLYVNKGYRQAGIVLLGDAFSTSCPAAGTGCNKVFTDVVRLCNVHIPVWLATAGMEKDKIDAFYNDEIKVACDRFSVDKAFYLRSFSTQFGLAWSARRYAKFVAHLGKGKLRQIGEQLALKALDPHGAPAR